MTLYYEKEADECFTFDIEEQVKMLIHVVCEFFDCPNEVEVSLLTVTEEMIQKLNQKHRKMNQITDVLSFPMLTFDKPANWNSSLFEQSKCMIPDTKELLLGDIVLCTKKVKEQALEFGHSEIREFSFLIVHSLLHLLGFDHLNEEDRVIMEKEQKEIMKLCKIER